jgi:hypothetical protein
LPQTAYNFAFLGSFYLPSGTYFGRVRINGKLIRRCDWRFGVGTRCLQRFERETDSGTSPMR